MGFIYYTRFFRSSDGSLPVPRGPVFAAFGSFSLVTLPSDNGTWSVTVFIWSGDQLLKRFRDARRWMSVVAACPLQAHWLDGEPLTDVLPMGGVVDRYRRLIVDGQPVATGIVPVADAWACTNPALGRGITLGLRHAQLLRDIVRRHLDDPRAFIEAWDHETETRLTPWYRETLAENEARRREQERVGNGAEPGQAGDAGQALRVAMMSAMAHDPDLFRAFLESRCCITPLSETLGRPEVVARIVQIARERERPASPGPTREQLLALLN